MPRFVVLLTQLLDWDEISSCIRTIEEERNVWMIKPFLQKPQTNMSQKNIAMEMGVHNETTSLLTLSGFSGANRLSSGTAISDPQSRDNDIIFTC